MGQVLSDLASGFSGTLGVWARHLGSGDEVSFGADLTFETASCIKVFVLAELFRQAETGRLSLTERLAVAGRHRVAGSGVLKDLGLDRVPILDLATLMIILSDNTATNVLIERLGRENINRGARRLGCPATTLHKSIEFQTGRPLGTSTPRELGRFFWLLAQDQVVDAAGGAAMLDILARQQYQTGLVRYLPYELMVSRDPARPAAVTVASKSGTLRGVRNDAGLIRTRWGDWVVAIMTRDCSDVRLSVDNEGLLVVSRASRAVFDHFVPVFQYADLAAAAGADVAGG